MQMCSNRQNIFKKIPEGVGGGGQGGDTILENAAFCYHANQIKTVRSAEAIPVDSRSV